MSGEPDKAPNEHFEFPAEALVVLGGWPGRPGPGPGPEAPPGTQKTALRSSKLRNDLPLKVWSQDCVLLPSEDSFF